MPIPDCYVNPQGTQIWNRGFVEQFVCRGEPSIIALIDPKKWRLADSERAEERLTEINKKINEGKHHANA